VTDPVIFSVPMIESVDGNPRRFTLPELSSGILFHNAAESKFMILEGATERPSADTAIYLGGLTLPAGALVGDVWVSSLGVVELVSGSAPVINTVFLPSGSDGDVYEVELEAVSPTPATWAVVSGSLPAGLTLSTDGIISGTPTVSGEFTFSIEAENDIGADTQIFDLVIESIGPKVIGTSTAGFSTLTSPSVPIPAGAQAGDTLVLILRAQSSTATAGYTAAGYTDITPAYSYPSTANRVNTILVKRLTTAETGSVSITAPAAAGTSRGFAIAALIRDLASSNLVVSSALAMNAWGTRDIPDVPEHTISLVTAAAEFSAPNDHADAFTISGLELGAEATTSALTSTSRTAGYFYYQQDLDPISDGNAGFVGPAVSSPVSIQITLRGLAKVKAPVAAVFDNVADFLSTPGATSAHRGLSTSFPEMSMYAYEHAADLGHGMLELSLGRTSDGVWFGIHDPTLARTSPSATAIKDTQTNALTWAQVQTASIELGISGAPQPYARMLDILDAFPNTLFLIDPKAAGNTTELLDILDGRGGTSRFIVKGFRGSGYFAAARARGYKIANYMYGGTSGDDPQHASFAAWIAEADSIGLNHEAGATDWGLLNDALAGTGKTAWGHILGSDANVAAVIALGADWVQCSNSAVTPVG
jgi:hypothetical protein